MQSPGQPGAHNLRTAVLDYLFLPFTLTYVSFSCKFCYLFSFIYFLLIYFYIIMLIYLQFRFSL